VGHADRIIFLLLLPSGDLSSGSADKSIRIWIQSVPVRIWNISTGLNLKEISDVEQDAVFCFIQLGGGHHLARPFGHHLETSRLIIYLPRLVLLHNLKKAT
jgi:hypothetical protein